MTATINDLFNETRKTTSPTVTTVQTARSIGGTSLVCADLTGWPTNTAVHFITYKKTASGLIDKSTQCAWKGIVSSNTINTLTLKSGTDAGNSVGDFVEMGPTAAWAQDLVSGLEVEHSVAGVHALTSSSTMTSPKLITSLNDTNGNEIFKVSPTASAVNEITIANGATGTGPTFTASGGDTNVDINFATKGSGKLKGIVNNLFNPYKFRAYSASSPVSYTNSDSSQKIMPIDTASFDTGSNFNGTTHLFTAPIAGFYFFHGQIALNNGSSGTGWVNSEIRKNGSVITSVQSPCIPQQPNTSVQSSVFVQLAANDTIGLYGASSLGFPIGVDGGALNTYLEGFLVSAT